MDHRATPLLLLVWLLLLSLAGALWMFLHGTPPTEFAPAPREVSRGGSDAPDIAASKASTEHWTLTGYVHNERGHALAGAHVESSGVRVDTDEQGRFDVRNLPGGEQELTVWKEGHTLVTQSVKPGDAPSVRLSRLVDLNGIVLLPDGRPAAGAVVTFGGWDDTERTTTSDAEGRFTFERVVYGRCSVHSEALVDETGGYQRSGTDAVAGSGETATITLRPGVAIRGIVRDLHGNPVEGAACHVSVYRDGHTWVPHRVTTDADGAFALAGEPVARTSVYVETPTEERGFRYLRWYAHRLDVAGPALDVRLEEGKPIAGRVVAPRGVDFAGKRMWACRIAGRERNVVTFGIVQADGTFHIGGLWDAWYELRLEGANALADRYVLTDGYRVQSGDTNVALRIGVARSVGGVVRNNAGDPVSSRGVLIQNDEKGYSRRVVTDENGRFDATRVPPGDVRVFVLRAGRNNGSFDCGSWPAGDVNIDVRVDE